MMELTYVTYLKLYKSTNKAKNFFTYSSNTHIVIVQSATFPLLRKATGYLSDRHLTCVPSQKPTSSQLTLARPQCCQSGRKAPMS